MITLEDLHKCRLRHAMHLDGPRTGKDAWFGDMKQCIEHPRLMRRTRYFRATKGHDITWYVDGAEVGPDLAAAVDKLNTPAVMTDAERKVFESLGAELTEPILCSR